MTEAVLLSRLDATRAMQDIQALSRPVDGASSGLGAGTVVSGSAQEHLRASELAARFRRLGLRVRIEEYPVRAHSYTVPAFSANGRPIAAIALQATAAVRWRRDGVTQAFGNEAAGARLRARLLDAGEGYAQDYARLGDVRGAIVLVHREARDWPPAQITEAAVHGAVAVVFHDHPSSGAEGAVQRQDSLWAHELVPAIAISRDDGAALRAQLARGSVEATIESLGEVNDGRSRNVVAVLPGTDLADEWVLVAAHYDRWFQGACDDVSGIAAVLELARAFASSGLHPRRSIAFIAMGSEEAGLEDPERDWLAGSNAFVGAHPEVMRRAALAFNIDMIGWSGARATLLVSADVEPAERAVLADLGLAGAIGTRRSINSAIDAWNFGVVGGAATAHLERVDQDYFPIYHTAADSAVPSRFAHLAPDLGLVAASLYRAATAARLPTDLASLADDVESQAAEDEARAPGAGYAMLRAALAELRSSLAGLPSDAAGARADETDRLLMAVRHDLMPWLYADDGDFEQALRTRAYALRYEKLGEAARGAEGGDRAAALQALAAIYEGRQCQRLSPAAYAFERGYWAGEGGWATRFMQRAPPPGPEFELACQALVDPAGDAAAAARRLLQARDEARFALDQSTAVMIAKLRQASARLAGFHSQGGKGQN